MQATSQFVFLLIDDMVISFTEVLRHRNPPLHALMDGKQNKTMGKLTVTNFKPSEFLQHDFTQEGDLLIRREKNVIHGSEDSR